MLFPGNNLGAFGRPLKVALNKFSVHFVTAVDFEISDVAVLMGSIFPIGTKLIPISNRASCWLGPKEGKSILKSVPGMLTLIGSYPASWSILMEYLNMAGPAPNAKRFSFAMALK